MHNWPDEILVPIHHSQEKFGIHPMNEKDIDMLKSYEHESFLVENYSAEFLASLN